MPRPKVFETERERLDRKAELERKRERQKLRQKYAAMGKASYLVVFGESTDDPIRVNVDANASVRRTFQQFADDDSNEDNPSSLLVTLAEVPPVAASCVLP